MTVHELAQSRWAPIGERGRRTPAASLPIMAISALTLLGAVLRVLVAHQSVFADELSTYWISATHGLGGVLSLMYGTGSIKHAEITPPLSFLLSWLTTRLGDSPELLRLPELIAGTATIPLVYLVGSRTIDRRAGLVAAALTTLSPFLIYYSAEARAYGVMIFSVLISTLAMLLALDTGRARWWVLYAVGACAAFYCHYTCVFVLGLQFLWVVWAHPEARRAVLTSSLVAAAGVLPWLPGLIRDFQSPTLKILSALSPFTATNVRIEVSHWAIGYPYTVVGRLTGLPGTVALVMLAVAGGLALVGLLALLRDGGSVGRLISGHQSRVLLVVGLALATPAGEALVSATGDHVFGVRNLAASWPYLALSGAAALTASRVPLAIAASGLTVLAFAIGASKMLGGQFTRPDYRSAADYVERSLRSGDVVVDETGALSPGPLTGLDAALGHPLPIFRADAPAERRHPFSLFDPIVPQTQAVGQAIAAARGHRLFLVALVGSGRPIPRSLPDGYRLHSKRRYSGIGGALVAIYARSGSSK